MGFEITPYDAERSKGVRGCLDFESGSMGYETLRALRSEAAEGSMMHILCKVVLHSSRQITPLTSCTRQSRGLSTFSPRALALASSNWSCISSRSTGERACIVRQERFCISLGDIGRHATVDRLRIAFEDLEEQAQESATSPHLLVANMKYSCQA